MRPAIDLGQNPWILLLLMFLELLFVIVPAIIASRLEDTTFTQQLQEMGFRRRHDSLLKNVGKVGAGVLIGFGFYFIGGYISFFFRNILVETLLGTEFIREASEGAINTRPYEPSLLQIVLLIFFQVALVGICEEAFFRGFLINKLNRVMSLTSTILLSSLIFAFYHVPPFLVPLSTILTFFGYYFTFGILLALVFLVFDFDLVPCIVAHSLFNILLLVA